MFHARGISEDFTVLEEKISIRAALCPVKLDSTHSHIFSVHLFHSLLSYRWNAHLSLCIFFVLFFIYNLHILCHAWKTEQEMLWPACKFLMYGCKERVASFSVYPWCSESNLEFRLELIRRSSAHSNKLHPLSLHAPFSLLQPRTILYLLFMGLVQTCMEGRMWQN